MQSYYQQNMKMKIQQTEHENENLTLRHANNTATQPPQQAHPTTTKKCFVLKCIKF